MNKITLEGKTIFITGAAGFIGAYLALKLLTDVEKIQIIG